MSEEMPYVISLEEIRRSLKDNKLVVFVGAGASRNYGYPDWNQLTLAFTNELGIELKKDAEGNNLIAADDYLLYPQYYLNKYGKKKYLKFVKDNLKPIDNFKDKIDIYKLLFEIRPQHIITTNFDRLLEKENNCLSDRYSVISSDSDLAQTTGNSYIIKMHGDLVKGKIVLTEDDYLNYETNFKLIDNFVKSLFATHSLLFIGFSLNDPNFKKIYHWVSCILGDDARRAYFFQTNKSGFDNNKQDYFNKKHIEIIEFKDWKYIDYPVKSQSEGEQLLFLLNRIKNNIIEDLYDIFLPLKDINYITAMQLRNIVRSSLYHIRFISEKSDELVIDDSDQIEILRNYEKSDDKYRFVISALSKARVVGLFEISFNKIAQCDYPNVIINIPESSESDVIEEKFINFKHLDIISDVIDNKRSEINFLKKKAFYSFKLGYDKKSLSLYKKLSKYYSDRKDYYNYVHCQYCMKIVLFRLSSDCYKNKTYWRKASAINLNKYIKNLPIHYRYKIQNYYETFFNSIENRYSSIFAELNDKIANDNNKIISGQWIQNSNIKKIRSLILELFEEIYSNYIPFDYYSDIRRLFKYYLKIIIGSYSTESKRNNNSKVNELYFFELFIAIYFLDFKELVAMQKENQIKYPLKMQSITTSDLILNFESFVSFFLRIKNRTTDKKQSVFVSQQINIGFNFIYILSICKMNMIEISSFYSLFEKFIRKISIYEIKEYISPILYNLSISKNFEILGFKSLMDRIFHKFNYKHFNLFVWEFDKYFWHVKKVNPKFKFKSQAVFLNIIDEAFKDIGKKNFNDLLYCLTNNFSLFGNKVKDKIGILVKKSSDIYFSNPHNRMFIMAFCNVIRNNILPEDGILEEIEKYFKYCKEFILSGKLDDNEKAIVFNCLHLSLVETNREINLDILNDLEGISSHFDIFVLKKQAALKDIDPKGLLFILELKNPNKFLNDFINRNNIERKELFTRIYNAIIKESQDEMRIKYDIILKMINFKSDLKEIIE